jgi:GNAT superfamily N-acetyltransferase
MKRDALAAIPQAPLPQGFSIRRYRPGDRDTWVAVYSAAEPFIPITPEVFDREFHGDEAGLRARMLFLCAPDGRAIGTSTAWYDDLNHDPAAGRIHWVAILPEFQGRGLAKPLLSASLRRLRALGHRHAYLITSTARIPAITLYLRYGFRPVPRTEAESAAWAACAPRLRPEIRPLCLNDRPASGN